MHIEVLGLDGALKHDPALAGLDPKPAAARRAPLVLEPEREVEHVARPVAQPQVGEGGEGESEQCNNDENDSKDKPRTRFTSPACGPQAGQGGAWLSASVTSKRQEQE